MSPSIDLSKSGHEKTKSILELHIRSTPQCKKAIRVWAVDELRDVLSSTSTIETIIRWSSIGLDAELSLERANIEHAYRIQISWFDFANLHQHASDSPEAYTKETQPADGHGYNVTLSPTLFFILNFPENLQIGNTRSYSHIYSHRTKKQDARCANVTDIESLHEFFKGARDQTSRIWSSYELSKSNGDASKNQGFYATRPQPEVAIFPERVDRKCDKRNAKTARTPRMFIAFGYHD
ncbi:hypothetical protein BJ508DRAFT_307735 [Ascobolus immersus RN42]|uniref:Uncharacterized protein n=1 Tax=Ascobolus immersus RN42 TaxID=1160509 RepID=A0A3N4I462_ASCIM|nr:hypothetical protein BJ508DRAFT_307735 [Ascobolus immersus RN42]